MIINNWKDRVIKALTLVAMSYENQLNEYGINFPITDEIALNYHDEIIAQIDYLIEIGVVNNLQYKDIMRIYEIFTRMSNDKNLDMWTNDALKTSVEWEECRKLAKNVIESL